MQLQDAGFAADQRLVEGQPGPAILIEIEEGGFDFGTDAYMALEQREGDRSAQRPTCGVLE
jgi:hypothetical protein